MKTICVKPFGRKWHELKYSFTYKDLKLFYEVIDLDGTCGRTMQVHKKGVFTDGKNYNPRYLLHWFPSCRCHHNVIFPCWILNGRKLEGKYAIITNDRHSAIINTETNEIFDPTYSANGTPAKVTLEMFQIVYEVENLFTHAMRVDKDIFERLFLFLNKSQKKVAQRLLKEKADKLGISL